MKTFTKKSVATEFSKKFPNHGTKTVARAIYRAHPNLFPSLAAAYATMRFVRGSLRRDMASKATDLKPLRFIESMPKSVNEVRKTFVIDGKQRVLVLSDIHIPHHDEKAFATAIKHGMKINPTVVYLNGDTVENYALSRWEPDPRKRDLVHEIKTARQGLKYIRERFPKARLIFKHGNHEARSEDYLRRKAPELLGVEDFQLNKLLRFDELGIEEVGLLQFAKIGKLNVIHGHELPKGIGNTVSAARTLFLRMLDTMLCGHFHQTHNFTEPVGVDRKLVSCWSTGCLCGLSPDFARVNKWTHGFAVVETDRNGDFEVSNLKVIGGKVF